MKTLADIVNETLSEAEGNLKIASSRDARTSSAVSDPLSFLDSELIVPVKLASDDDDEDERKAREKKDKDKKDEPEKKASLSEVVSDAEFAVKLAEALTLGSGMVAAKLASGPQVQQSGMQHASTVPRAHSKVTDKITGPSVQGPSALPTDKKDFTSTGDQSGRAQNHPGKTAAWTQDPQASVQLLRAKTAQAEVLMNLGQIDAAEAVLAEVQSKIAQDPSSPQPSMPAHGTGTKLDTEPGPATHIADNSGLIAMTKSQARDKTTREVSQYISEPPKKDNAVAAHTLRTDGQKVSVKLSHLVLPRVNAVAPPPAAEPEKTAEATLDPALGRAYLAKLLKTASDPDASSEERTKAAGALNTIKAKLGLDPLTLLA